MLRIRIVLALPIARSSDETRKPLPQSSQCSKQCRIGNPGELPRGWWAWRVQRSIKVEGWELRVSAVELHFQPSTINYLLSVHAASWSLPFSVFIDSST